MGDFQFDFEKLKVYQKSLDFIDRIFDIYKQLDQEYKFSIGNNLVRAGLSVANNLAEGNDKKSPKERRDILKSHPIQLENVFLSSMFLKGKVFWITILICN
jgi:hypothetical protein